MSNTSVDVIERRNAISKWQQATSIKLCNALRDIGDQIRICKMAREQGGLDPEIARHQASLIRQWAILCDLDDDLNDPKLLGELWQQRADIDAWVSSLG
jgi:hypothetical protein